MDSCKKPIITLPTPLFIRFEAVPGGYGEPDDFPVSLNKVFEPGGNVIFSLKLSRKEQD
jgi:hypothetical protein